jgi:transcriptional regulator with XRE-family HTH domain
LTKKTLGSVVKEARDGARMTQRQLATEVGIKASHVAYIENGHRRPSISLINLNDSFSYDGVATDSPLAHTASVRVHLAFLKFL